MELLRTLKTLFWKARNPRVLENMHLLKGCLEDQGSALERFDARGYRKEIIHEIVGFLVERRIQLPKRTVESMIVDCARMAFEAWEVLPTWYPDDLHRAIREHAFEYADQFTRSLLEAESGIP